MFLSTDTVSILKNFSNINQSILIKPGKTLSSMSVMKNILVEANITEEFEEQLAIYDLNQFLNCLSLIPGAELGFESNSITISDGTNSIEYRCSDPSVITAPPNKELKLPSEDVFVTLSEENIEKVKKAAAVLQVPDLLFVGDGKSITLKAGDKKNSGSNSFSVCVGETDKVFRAHLKTENLKLLPGDYEVVISKKNLALFTSHSHPYKAFIALEPDSTWSD